MKYIPCHPVMCGINVGVSVEMKVAVLLDIVHHPRYAATRI